MPEDKEFNSELVDQFLRYLRGRGPRPSVDQFSDDERAEIEDLFQLLEAIVDSDEVEVPPIDEDPVGLRLGLAGGENEDTPEPPTAGHDAGAENGLNPIAKSLEEVAHRLGGEVEITPDEETPVPGHDANGLLPSRAVCRALGEVVLVCVTDREQLAELPREVALVFAERPMTTAVAVVSAASSLAVVLTEADCVPAIDPVVGWVDPALPRSPEPLGLALGRYLEGSLPRWDDVARLDDILMFNHAEEEIAAAVSESLDHHLNRSVKIPAKKTALEELGNLPPDLVASVVVEVRAGALAGDNLVQRLREVSEAGTP